MNKISSQIPLDKLAPGGIAGELVILDIFENESRMDEDRLNDKEARRFDIQAALSKFPSSNQELSSVIDKNEWGSYFLAHPNSVITKIYSPVGEFEIHHNDCGELSVVKYSCEASSLNEARKKFTDGIMPFFDYMSFISNSPIFIPLIVCKDTKNNLHSFNYIAPHKISTINPHEASLTEELIPIYALFREAKNSHSAYYRFLCYYKILEGIYRKIRGDTFKKAKANGISINTIKECVPIHPEISKDLSGRPIGPMFEDRFTKSFRDRVAHYILDDNSALNVSSHEAEAAFLRELFLLEQCARVVIRTQEQYCLAANKGLA